MIPLFQCILYSYRTDHSGLLLAACGDSIYSISASSGSCLSIWSLTKSPSPVTLKFKDQEVNGAAQETIGPECPSKRSRLSGEDDISDSTSAEIVIESDSKKARKYKPRVPPVPAIFKLAVTSAGKHVVAITDEDKCIRVLEVLANGTLHEISERRMPKRPCAVTFTTDESLILCADKFGDVYALPLLITSNEVKIMTKEKPAILGHPSHEMKPTTFVPSANELTVHTKRNQQALKNQQSALNKAPEKKSLDFDQQLLLGHVSLLTDLVYITICIGDSSPAESRSYILTSDRDEHIRVSRGLPQAYIVEGYCLEHSEFVSRLCVPSWDPRLLVSGGGDDFLLIWNWLDARMLQKVDLKASLATFFQKSGEKQAGGNEQPWVTADTASIAVSGIWVLRTYNDAGSTSQGEIIVTCERIPAIAVYSWLSDGTVEYHQTLGTDSNVVDVAICQEQLSIIYSMDIEEMSTPMTDNTLSSPAAIVGSFTYSKHECIWAKDATMEKMVLDMNLWAATEEGEMLDSMGKRDALSESIYTTEKLRKRGQNDE